MRKEYPARAAQTVIRPLLRLCTTVVLAGALGCGGGASRPETAPVTGTVTYNGKPVANATVMFTPKSGGASATGKTDENGKFTLTTFEPGDGAIVGEHVVTVTYTGPESGAPENPESPEAYGAPAEKGAAEKPPIPTKYANPKTSGLTFEVKAGGPNEFTIELTD